MEMVRTWNGGLHLFIFLFVRLFFFLLLYVMGFTSCNYFFFLSLLSFLFSPMSEKDFGQKKLFILKAEFFEGTSLPPLTKWLSNTYKIREKMASHHLQNKRSNKDLEHEINILWRGTKFSSFFFSPFIQFFSPLSKKDFWRNICPYMKNVPFFCLKRKKMKVLHIWWEWTIFSSVLPRAPISKFRRKKIIFMIF